MGIVGCGSGCRELVGRFARAGTRVRVVPWGDGDGAAGLWSTPFREHIQVCRNPSGLYGCDLVIERLLAGRRAQLRALRRIEAALSSGAILAVSTDLAPLDRIAQGLRRPEQAVGVFFAPGGLVELSRTLDTAPGVHQAARQAFVSLGMRPFEAVADAAE